MTESERSNASTAQNDLSVSSTWHVPPVPDERRVALYALADEGRAFAEQLIATPASIEELQAATAALRSLRSRLPHRNDVASEGTSAIERATSFRDQSPIHGFGNMLAPHLALRVVDEHIEGEVTFSAAYEGAPGHVHGGWIAAVFDEVLGMVQALPGAPGMTGKLEVNYRKPTPLGRPIHVIGHIDRVEGRKIFTSGRSFDPETGVTYAESTGLFISIDFSRFTSATRPGIVTTWRPDDAEETPPPTLSSEVS